MGLEVIDNKSEVQLAHLASEALHIVDPGIEFMAMQFTLLVLTEL
jgi:hypothetical protein